MLIRDTLMSLQLAQVELENYVYMSYTWICGALAKVVAYFLSVHISFMYRYEIRKRIRQIYNLNWLHPNLIKLIYFFPTLKYIL